MNSTTFLRLTWKEYRTVRLFWLSVVVLVGLIEWLAVLFSQQHAETLKIVFNFALGAPAFFAIGCAGAAFAAEREEGTFDFLRASPVSSVEVLASKLLLVTLATAAMFVALLPLAGLISGARLTDVVEWRGMLGLWLVAVVEAIAWGTLFSLLGARPLLAVVLALVAASTCAHALAWTQRELPNVTFEWPAYLRAAPWRGLLSVVVLIADVYLGLRWLDGESGKRKKRSSAGRTATESRAPVSGTFTPVLSQREREKDVCPLLAKRDHSAMLGHLLWQHSRQSWRLMLTMGLLFSLASIISMRWPIAVLATLMGTMVFLPDQERQRYRFFAEHNVPPRLVWLARQIPWLVTLLISISVLCLVWLFVLGDGSELLRVIETVTDRRWLGNYGYYGGNLPPVGLGIAVAAVAYAAGQWVSILVRSGIMAGFLGLLFSGLLYGWVALMHAMQVSFLWSVWPIPLVLLWATWLRAPDWIGENKRWSARGRLVAALLVPAIPLLIAVPLYRVHQVPDVSPGFDPVQYEADIKANLAAGTVTADMYRKANDLLTPRPNGPQVADSESYWKKREVSRPPNPTDQEWLKQNLPSLTLLLKATERPVCIIGDPRRENTLPWLANRYWLTELMLVSARQLEGEGKPDAALDRYIATLQGASRLPTVGPDLGFPEVFRQLAYWGAEPGQTPDRISGALKRLQSIDPRMLRLDESIKSNYILGQRMAYGDSIELWEARRYSLATDVLWLKLMPWESDRAVRVLNLLSHTALQRLQEMRSALDQSAKGEIEYSATSGNVEGAVRYFCQARGYFAVPNGFFETKIESYWDGPLSKKAQWLESTVPNLSGMGYNGFQAANDLAAFETERRAAMIVLALESYRLDHGELPNSLDELKGRYFAAVPLDPYSGLEFQYLRTGVPTPEIGFDPDGFIRSGQYAQGRPGGPIEYGVPAVWSTGPELTPETYVATRPDGTAVDNGEKSPIIIGYSLGWGYGRRSLPKSAGWGYGYWFGIPAMQPK